MSKYPYLLAIIILELGCSKNDKAPGIPEKSETVYSHFRYGRFPERLHDTAFVNDTVFVVSTVKSKDSIFHSLYGRNQINPAYLTINNNILKANYFFQIPLDSPNWESAPEHRNAVSNIVDCLVRTGNRQTSYTIDNQRYSVKILRSICQRSHSRDWEYISYFSLEFGYLFTIASDSTATMPSNQFSATKEKPVFHKLIQAVLKDTTMMPTKEFFHFRSW